MRNCDYRTLKEAIESGRSISKESLMQLKNLNAMYDREIRKLMAKPDVAKAMYFKEDQFEIIRLIRCAKVEE